MIDINYIKENKLLLFEVISGSHAYGLATDTSDTDIKGVFYLPKDYFYRQEYLPQISNESNDIVYYELGRFIELLYKSNPTVLEMLATPEKFVCYKHALMEAIKPALFLSKLAKDTFARYAFTQIKKAKGLNKKINNPMSDKRKSVLDFCFILDKQTSIPLQDWLSKTNRESVHCGLSPIKHIKGLYALYYDEWLPYNGIVSDDSANEVNNSSIDAQALIVAYLFFNQDAYSAHCKTYKEYQEWKNMRNEHRYQGNQQHGQGYDTKNMMHTIRLLQVAEELIRTGTLNIYRENRAELLAIKEGKFSYETILEKANLLMENIEAASDQSPLPDAPDQKIVQALLVSIRNKLYEIEKQD